MVRGEKMLGEFYGIRKIRDQKSPTKKKHPKLKEILEDAS